MAAIEIVVPCYNESENIQPLIDAIEALDLKGHSVSILFVDDGSADETWLRINQAAQNHQRVSGIRLSRNFGHQSALLAGLHSAKGDAVISMDGDLQHPASLIPKLISEWEQGAHIVTTTRAQDPELSLLKRLASNAFYKIFGRLTGLPLRAGQADFRLIDRKALDALLALEERAIFLRGMVAWCGFRQVDLPYEPAKRHSGASEYSPRKMLKLAGDAIVSFSVIPLRISLVIGVITTLISMTYLTYAVVVRLFVKSLADSIQPGWASLIVLVSFFFGILFIQMGILGEYLARIYEETKRRPRYIITDSSIDSGAGHLK